MTFHITASTIQLPVISIAAAFYVDLCWYTWKQDLSLCVYVPTTIPQPDLDMYMEEGKQDSLWLFGEVKKIIPVLLSHLILCGVWLYM